MTKNAIVNTFNSFECCLITYPNNTASLICSGTLHMRHKPFICMTFIISAKEVMFSVALVCLSFFLFVCLQQYSKNYELIMTKSYGRVPGW